MCAVRQSAMTSRSSRKSVSLGYYRSTAIRRTSNQRFAAAALCVCVQNRVYYTARLGSMHQL